MPKDKWPEMELEWESESISFQSCPKLLPMPENKTRKCQYTMDEKATAKFQYDL